MPRLSDFCRLKWRVRKVPLLICVGLILGGCDSSQGKVADRTRAPGTEIQKPAPSPPVPAEFQVGRWQGTGPLALGEDPKKSEASVPGNSKAVSIDFTVDGAGRVSGQAQCGERTAELSGVYDEAKLRATFVGEQMIGTLVLAKAEPELRGQVRLSIVERTKSGEVFHAFTSELILKKSL